MIYTISYSNAPHFFAVMQYYDCYNRLQLTMTYLPTYAFDRFHRYNDYSYILSVPDEFSTFNMGSKKNTESIII